MIINKMERLSYRTWVENMNDEARDPFEKDRGEGELAENGSSFQSSELGFVKDLQVLFGAVQPF